ISVLTLRFPISHAATVVFPNAVGAHRIPSSWAVIFATASSWNGRSRPRNSASIAVPAYRSSRTSGRILCASRRAKVSVRHACVRAASPRHSDMLHKFLAACDHTRLVVRREPHDLALVELRVLKGCQRQFISTIRRMPVGAVEEIVAEAQRKGDLIGVRMSIADDEEAQDPWTLPPSRKRRRGSGGSRSR